MGPAHYPINLLYVSSTRSEAPEADQIPNAAANPVSPLPHVVSSPGMPWTKLQQLITLQKHSHSKEQMRFINPRCTRQGKGLLLGKEEAVATTSKVLLLSVREANWHKLEKCWGCCGKCREGSMSTKITIRLHNRLGVGVRAPHSFLITLGYFSAPPVFAANQWPVVCTGILSAPLFLFTLGQVFAMVF